MAVYSSFPMVNLVVSSLSVVGVVVGVVVPARSPRRARPVFRNQFRERPFHLPEAEEEEEEEEEEYPCFLPEEEEEQEEEVGRSFLLCRFFHNIGLIYSCKTSQFFFSKRYTPLSLSLFVSSRRKNKHPKRAENVKTVVVASAVEERKKKKRRRRTTGVVFEDS